MEMRAQLMTTAYRAGVKERLQRVVKGHVEIREPTAKAVSMGMPTLVVARTNARVANVDKGKSMEIRAQPMTTANQAGAKER
jgi:hypothetical protein